MCAPISPMAENSTPKRYAFYRSCRIKLPNRDLTPHLASPSTDTILCSLLTAARDVDQARTPRCSPANSSAFVIRKIKTLCIVLEDIFEYQRENPSSTLPRKSTTISFKKIFEVVQMCASLIRDKSRLWNVINHEEISLKWQEIEQQLARSLESLDIGELPLSEDAKEIAENMVKTCRRTSQRVYQEDIEWRLKRQLDNLIQYFERACEVEEDLLRRVLNKVGICSASDCREEEQKLGDEVAVLGCRINKNSEKIRVLNTLIHLVGFAETTVFGPVTPNKKRTSKEIPREFMCPISRLIMRDPVVANNGHTYERRFLQNISKACPRDNIRASEIVPNYAIRGCIQQWCVENNMELEIDETQESVTGTAEFLVGKLATGSSEVQAQAAGELRLLAKTNMETRRKIADAGAIPFLVNLLSVGDAKAQENAVTALLNLSINERNKALVASDRGTVEAIVEIVRNGLSMTARGNAAATLYVLCCPEDEHRAMVADVPGSVHALVDLLLQGTLQARKDAMATLLNLAHCKTIKPLMVSAGTVAATIELMVKKESGDMMEDGLSLLSSLADCSEGARAAVANPILIPMLVEILSSGCEKKMILCCAVLAGICKVGGYGAVRTVTEAVPQCLPVLRSAALAGSPCVRRKVSWILKAVNPPTSPSKISCFCA